jgi:hypothetical protein
MSLRDRISLIGSWVVSVILRRPGDWLASRLTFLGFRSGYVQQTGMLILVEVPPGTQVALRKTLDGIRATLTRYRIAKTIASFYATKTVHYAAWMILPGVRTVGGPPGPAQLAFETNYDGDLAAHLNDLVANCRAELDLVYAAFPAYPPPGSPSSSVVNFLFDKYQGTKIDAFAYYVALPGRSLADIRNAIAVYEEAKRFIDTANTYLNLRTALIAHFKPKMNGRARPERFAVTTKGLTSLLRMNMVVLTLFYLVMPTALMTLGYFWGEGRINILWNNNKTHPYPISEVCRDAIAVLRQQFPMACRHHYVFAVLTLLCLLPLFYFIRWLMIDLVAGYFEYKESKQKLFDPTCHKATYDLLDLGRQNHLCSFTTVKPGWFRMYVMKRALWFGTVFSNYISILGKLDQIATIHFARWTLVGQQLIFYGSYDGSWSSYLTDFSDEAWGVNLIWGNTIGFPETKFITLGGARDLEGFQNQAMEHYAAAPVFYSAYPTHSLVNLIRYLEFRDEMLEEIGE